MTIHAPRTHLQSLRVLTPGDASLLPNLTGGEQLGKVRDQFAAEHGRGTFEQEGGDHGLGRVVLSVVDEALEALLVESPSELRTAGVGRKHPTSQLGQELVRVSVLKSLGRVRCYELSMDQIRQRIAFSAENGDGLGGSRSGHSSAGPRIGRGVFIIHRFCPFGMMKETAPSVVFATEGHPSAPQSQRLQQRRYDQDDHASAICKHSEWRLGDRSNSANSAVNQRVSRDSVKTMSGEEVGHNEPCCRTDSTACDYRHVLPWDLYPCQRGASATDPSRVLGSVGGLKEIEGATSAQYISNITGYPCFLPYYAQSWDSWAAVDLVPLPTAEPSDCAGLRVASNGLSASSPLPNLTGNQGLHAMRLPFEVTADPQAFAS